MKKISKIISFLIVISLVGGCLAGCTAYAEEEPIPTETTEVSEEQETAEEEADEIEIRRKKSYCISN